MPAPSASAEILLVDDDEGMRLLLSDCLKSAGFRVSTVESGRAAAAALRQHRPDLMLLDLHLDDTTAPSLLPALEREGLGVPFIVITGQGDEKAAVEMMKRGALDYVMKESAILELLPAVVRRALAQVEHGRELEAARAEHRRLEREILGITEDERQRIGADLHDGVGQQLTAVELMCFGLKGDVAALDPKLGRDMDRICGLLREAIGQTRALARGLSPLDEQPAAFHHGLAGLVERFGALGVRCRLEYDADVPAPPRAAANHLYRIAQEAMHNAIKHSGASEVLVRWARKDGAPCLEVLDNGRGLPEGRNGGLGLGIMRYRAGIINARLDVESIPGAGVGIVCRLPQNP